MIVEICAYTIQSCLIADNAEADRIEFCANPQLDGTTPNLFELKYLLNKLNISERENSIPENIFQYRLNALHL